MFDTNDLRLDALIPANEIWFDTNGEGMKEIPSDEIRTKRKPSTISFHDSRAFEDHAGIWSIRLYEPF